MATEFIRARPALRATIPQHGNNLYSAKDDVEYERSKYSNARDDDGNAVVYRLDKFEFPGGLGTLLGNDERRADNSAVVDE